MRGSRRRIDGGVEEGSVVGVDYDPLLAKLVVRAETRGAAIARARRALSEWIVLGVETKSRLLDAVLASSPSAFRSTSRPSATATGIETGDAPRPATHAASTRPFSRCDVNAGDRRMSGEPRTVSRARS